MTLSYSLGENDYLQNQLYIASKSDRVKSQRRRSLIIMALASLMSSIAFFVAGNKVMAYTFAVLSVVILIFYPSYLRNYYKKYYQKIIADTYKSRFNEPFTMIFNDTTIETVGKTSENRINHSVIDEIVETDAYIYLRITTGGNLIIPKSKIENVSNALDYLHTLANKLNIKFTQELNWEWS